MDFNAMIDRHHTYSTQWDYTSDRFGVSDILPFSISDTDFKAPQCVLDTLNDAVEFGVFGYTRWNHDDFKGAIMNYYRNRFSVPVHPDWIVYSPSVMYTVACLIRELSAPQEAIAAFDPMYDAFIDCIESNHRQLIPLRFNEDMSIDWVACELALKQAKVFLLCSPHNPTGKVFTADELSRLCALCQKHATWLISDEIHSDLILFNHKHLPIVRYVSASPRLILVSSASKTYNIPGLGGSYAMICDAALRDAFLNQQRHCDFLNSANLMGMKALMSAYTQGESYRAELVQHVEMNFTMLDQYLKANIPEIHFTYPQATYLAWLDFRSSGYELDEIQRALIHIGKVGLMRGEVYGTAGSGYFRMNIGCTHLKLMDGLQRINQAFDYLREGRHSDAGASISDY